MGNMAETGERTDDQSSDLRTPGEKTPVVSVCIPLYMKERFIAETIQSVLDQTFTNFELIILHNASPDRSAEVAESFDDPRIRVFHNSMTVSGQENFAKLVPLTNSPLIKIVSADDLMHPTLLEKQVVVMQDPGIALVGCRQNVIDEHSEIVYRDRSLRTSDLVGRQDRATVLRRVVRHMGNPIGAHVNGMFRRSAYDAAGGIPDGPFIAGDLALWLELLRYGHFYGMDETLVDFRIVESSASATDCRSGIDDQVRFIGDLRRDNRDIVRISDAAYGTFRTPVMRLRHRLIVSAAGPKGSAKTRAATKVLSLSRGTSKGNAT